MVIPKIIHQTWKTRKLPEDFDNWSKSWKNLNPNWDYRFYDDRDCWKFIYNNYPEFIDLYDSLIPIQRADIFRYLILHKYGGVYVDMDTMCFKPLDSLTNNVNSLITGIEYEGNESGITTMQYLQWFIASPPGHNTLIEFVKEVERRNWYLWFYSLFKTENSITYWLTGPEMFTSVINDTNEFVKIMPKGILGCYDTRKLTSESYLNHFFKGSWKKNWSKNRIPHYTL